MAQNVKTLLLPNYGCSGVWILCLLGEQIWERLSQEVSNRNVVIVLLPLVEIVLIVHFDIVSWLNEIGVHVGEYTNSVLSHISDMLVTEWLVYLPEEFVIVLLYSI